MSFISCITCLEQEKSDPNINITAVDKNLEEEL